MAFTNRFKFLVFNFVGLQLTWAACAYGATHQSPLFGVYVGGAYLVLHFIIVKQRLRDAYILALIASLGVVVDILNSIFNIVAFPHADNLVLLIPFWLIVLWQVFSLTVPHCMNWLEKNMFLASMAGAIGGSVSYWFGQSLGAIQFPQSIALSTTVYFIEWAIILPLSFIVLRKINRIV